MNRLFALLLAVALLSIYHIILPNEGVAGTISISTKTSSKVENNQLETIVEVQNNGNETAHGVFVEINLLGKKYRGSDNRTVRFEGKEQFDFKIDIQQLSAGRYPIVVRVMFRDASGYPFSALSASYFVVDRNQEPDLICISSDISLAGKGNLIFLIQNPTPLEKELRAELVLPQAFITRSSVRMINIKPHSNIEIEYNISNKTAIPDAIYPVSCILEYEEGGYHNLVLANANVTVAPATETNWFFKTKWYWLIALGAFIAGLCLTAVFNKIFSKTK